MILFRSILFTFLISMFHGSQLFVCLFLLNGSSSSSNFSLDHERAGERAIKICVTFPRCHALPFVATVA